MSLVINLIICFYILQRLCEIVISKKNERILITKFNATYAFQKDAVRMKVLHVLWFIFLIVEANVHKTLIRNSLLYPIIIILILAQLIRYSSIKKLGVFWTVTIMKIPPHELFSKGLYQIIRHPNYFAVILELILVPLMFKSYITLFLFSFLNLIVLKKRIDLEEKELEESGYLKIFQNKKRILPLVY